MLVRPEVFLTVGGFDEGYVNGYEDVDFCLEVRARGGKIVFTPASVVTHHESVTEGRFDASAANTERLMARWIDRFDESGSQYDVDFRRTARALARRAGAPGRQRGRRRRSLDLDHRALPGEPLVHDRRAGRDPDRRRQRGRRRRPLRRALRRPASGARARAGHAGRGVGFPRAFAAGLAAASRPLAALVGPNVRVAGDWLGRLVAHRRDDPTAGAITATLGDAASLTTAELLTPTGRTGRRCRSRRRGADVARRAAAGLVAGDGRHQLHAVRRHRAICARSPPAEALFGAEPGAMARAARAGAASRCGARATSSSIASTRSRPAPTRCCASATSRLQRRRAARPRATTPSATPLVSVIVVSGGDRAAHAPLRRRRSSGSPTGRSR